MDASDNETLPSARHGQNEPAMALGRRAWLFAGSQRGGERAAFMYSLIVTAKKDERYRPAGLAGGRVRQNAEPAALELVPCHINHPGRGGLMPRPTLVSAIEYVAALIGENLKLLNEIASSPDNIDHGERIHVHDGVGEGITTFTDRGIESLQEFLADIRTWEGGVR